MSSISSSVKFTTYRNVDIEEMTEEEKIYARRYHQEEAKKYEVMDTSTMKKEDRVYDRKYHQAEAKKYRSEKHVECGSIGAVVARDNARNEKTRGLILDKLLSQRDSRISKLEDIILDLEVDVCRLNSEVSEDRESERKLRCKIADLERDLLEANNALILESEMGWRQGVRSEGEFQRRLDGWRLGDDDDDDVCEADCEGECSSMSRYCDVDNDIIDDDGHGDGEDGVYV